MPGFAAVDCSNAKLVSSPCSLVVSDPTLPWFWAWSSVAEVSAEVSCCRAWVNCVWSWETFWMSCRHADVDASWPEQALLFLARSELRAAVAVFTFADGVTGLLERLHQFVFVLGKDAGKDGEILRANPAGDRPGWAQRSIETDGT